MDNNKINVNNRNAQRLKEMDLLFTMLRVKKVSLDKVNGAYKSYKEELIQTQNNMIELNKITLK